MTILKNEPLKAEPRYPSSLNAALDYAKRGWRVFPVCPPVKGECTCGRACGSPGKHPHVKSWPTKATIDPKQISKWWQKWPNDNVGIATGKESRLLVIDVDGEAGNASLTELENAYGMIPATLTAKTARGRHFFFLHTDEMEIKCSAGTRLGDGIDVRAEKGYVVAPPSTHATGFIYDWIRPDAALIEAPHWLLDLLTAENICDASPLPLVDDGSPIISEGSRNITLTQIAGRLREQGQSQNEITAELLLINRDRCARPLQDDEVIRIATSISSYPLGKKRTERTIPGGQESPLYWFAFNVNEWFADPKIRLLNDRQRGWLISLMASAFQEGGFLQNDMSKLFTWAGASSLADFAANSALVLDKFEVVEIEGVEMLMHERLAARYLDACQKVETKRTAGKASGQARRRNYANLTEIRAGAVPCNVQFPSGSVN
jgi:hypothetical protein